MGRPFSSLRRRRSCVRSGRLVESCRTISDTDAFPARLRKSKMENGKQDIDEASAVIADVHANTWALEAALEDIRRRGIARIVNLGDCVYGSLDPAGTAERLMDTRIISIAGNQDRDVF